VLDQLDDDGEEFDTGILRRSLPFYLKWCAKEYKVQLFEKVYNL
jgi:hypothetical protein